MRAIKSLWNAYRLVSQVAADVENRLKYRLQILFGPVLNEETCPICGMSRTKAIEYGRDEYVTGSSLQIPEVQGHSKYLCLNCGHFFTNWLKRNIETTAKLYSGRYHGNELFIENFRAKFQKELLYYVLKRLNCPEKARLLDFGCGPNISPTYKLREEGYDVRCCDILPDYKYDGDIYFQHTNDSMKWRGHFDAIVSIDVIEHLGNTLETWLYFNQVLKINGIMAHCFPSRYHFGFNHYTFRTAFHTCLFSKNSLSLLLEKTGFVLEAVEPFDADIPYLFRFRKTQDVDESREIIQKHTGGQ